MYISNAFKDLTLYLLELWSQSKPLYLFHLSTILTHLRASFFFLCGFSFTNIHDLQDSKGEGEGICLTPPYHFHSLYWHLSISWAINAENSPLHIASSRNTNRELLVSERLSLITKLHALLTVFIVPIIDSTSMINQI